MIEALQYLSPGGNRARVAEQPEAVAAIADLYTEAALDLAQVFVEFPANIAQAFVVLGFEDQIQRLGVFRHRPKHPTRPLAPHGPRDGLPANTSSGARKLAAWRVWALAAQRLGIGRGDTQIDELSDQFGAADEVHHAVVFGTTRELIRVLA